MLGIEPFVCVVLESDKRRKYSLVVPCTLRSSPAQRTLSLVLYATIVLA